jgi:radical SAM protein with 4Fe4S-binding SPASM domain
MTHNLAAIQPRTPHTCFFEITEACNLRCVHCWNVGGERSTDELSTDEALDAADQLAAAGCREVRLTGGEPLLRGDWPAIAKRFAAHGIEVWLITNGTLVDDRAVAAMRESGVSRVAVSIDGEREVHDEIRLPADRAVTASRFDAAVRALELLSRAGLPTTVITQIHKRNAGRLSAVRDLALGAGADAWQVQLAMPLGRLLDLRYEYLVEVGELPEIQGELARLVDEGGLRITVTDNIGYYGPHEAKLRGADGRGLPFFAGCQAGCRVVAVCADGAVRGCPSHPAEFAVGSLRRERFAAIWSDAARFPYNTEFREEHLEGGCKRCAYRRVCRAGCTTMAYAATGTIYDNPFCVQRAGRGDG